MMAGVVARVTCSCATQARGSASTRARKLSRPAASSWPPKIGWVLVTVKAGFQHQLRQALERAGPPRGSPHQMVSHRGQPQVLAQQVLAQRGQVREQRRAWPPGRCPGGWPPPPRRSRTACTSPGTPAIPSGRSSSGSHSSSPTRRRITSTACRPAQRLEEDAPAAHRQVAAVDQRVAQVLGQEGLLEVGRDRWAPG